ncbi:MAG: aspartate kinase [Bacteroidia bacterium]|nr:aspartate kinase [Bacteroidia bacterium]MCZ2276581.1 aspartate kinase [Bacteroidia bacterium]
MLTVHKFGGASVKDADSVRNVASVITHLNEKQSVIVVSAMGKTTNALEKVVGSFFSKDPAYRSLLDEIQASHLKIADELFPSGKPELKERIQFFFDTALQQLVASARSDYNFTYDQVVPVGELVSTLIVDYWLRETGIASQWADARNFIKTDQSWRNATLSWEHTCPAVSGAADQCFRSGKSVFLTQGFIGSTDDHKSTTLGREGSDYTAAILAHCLNAEKVVFWKDVSGVLSADPRYFSESLRFDEISYHDAIELTYYGASIIHPKTIKPLENKRIPLFVKSFRNPESKGTQIAAGATTHPKVPSFILKPAQILISISAKDFSFIAENNLSQLFALFAKHKVKINLMQNSAISFTVCTDNDPMKIPLLVDDLKNDYSILFNENLSLYTIRNYYPVTIESFYKEKDILLEQRSRNTAQLVIREANT